MSGARNAVSRWLRRWVLGLATPGALPADTVARLDEQIGWYDAKATYCQRWYKRLKRLEIVVAALIPLFAALDKGWTAYVTAGLGAAVVILEGWQQASRFHDLWLAYRAAAAALARERFLFVARAAPYDDTDEANRLRLLAVRTEDVIAQESGRWVALLTPREASGGGAG
jgi:hypothetical protein